MANLKLLCSVISCCSSLHYWLCIYCHITNKETLPASHEQILDVIDNFSTICHSLCNLPIHSGVLLAYDNDCFVNENLKFAGNFDFLLKSCSQMTSGFFAQDVKNK